MKKVLLITFGLAVGVVSVAYCSGVRFSSNALVVRHISFSKIKDIKCFWKQSGGCSLGSDIDFLEFGERRNAFIVNDTLYVGGEPKAVVVKAMKRYFACDYELCVKRLSDGERCYYSSK